MSSSSPFDNMLRAAIRALDEVVGPSIDPANPLANEQMRLVCRFLDLVRQRAAHVADLQRAELNCALELARSLSPHAQTCSADVSNGLATAQRDAEALLAAVGTEGAALEQAARRLDAHVSAIVRFAGRMDPIARQGIERAVLAGSKRVLDLRRA